MQRDENPQGIGLPPEQRTPQQELYRRFRQERIQAAIEAQQQGKPAPHEEIDPRALYRQIQQANQSPRENPRIHPQVPPNWHIEQDIPSNRSKKKHNGQNHQRHSA